MEEEACKELFDYLANNTYSKGSTKNSKRRLREKAKTFFVRDDAVFHRRWKEKKQRVVRRREVEELLQQMHSSVVGGAHLEINATQQKTAERFWWATMSEDIRQCVCTVL